MCMEGCVLNLYQWVDSRTPILCWGSFKLALIDRFRSSFKGLAYEALVSLKQSGTVTEFIKPFESYVAPLREVREVGIFMISLRKKSGLIYAYPSPTPCLSS